jgi:exopolyphosphatase / guanosine-5'-triphosphate,3'-diphosphate pyrophosphatase
MPVRQPQPLAVVDIGSNSGRVIVVRLGAGGHLEILSDARTSLRLIRDIGASGRLGAVAEERTLTALQDFQAVAAGAGADRIIAVATAAVREAANCDAFVARLSAETGLEIRVIDGDEEARYAFLGAVHGLPVDSGLLVDVGGGSLEISRFRNRRALRGWTLPLGALRLTDRFLASDPPSRGEVGRLQDHVVASLREAGITPLEDGEAMVGTGGTIRNLAKAHRAAISYPVPRLHGYVLTRRGLRDVGQRVLGRTLGRRTAIPGLSADRADSIAGGALVVQAVMDELVAPELVVSGQGLREGIAFEELSRRLPSTGAVREASMSALAARFTTWDPKRAERRCRLAARLLDLLAPEAGDEMRETLDHAATILDAGRSVDYYNRWQHAADIVVAADLRGFSHRSIALLAAVIARGGRDRVSLSPYSSLLDPSDRALVDRAAVVLALADEVERRMAPGVSPKVERRDRRRAVELTVPIPHAWQAVDVAARFHRVFGRRLEVLPAAE